VDSDSLGAAAQRLFWAVAGGRGREGEGVEVGRAAEFLAAAVGADRRLALEACAQQSSQRQIQCADFVEACRAAVDFVQSSTKDEVCACLDAAAEDLEGSAHADGRDDESSGARDRSDDHNGVSHGYEESFEEETMDADAIVHEVFASRPLVDERDSFVRNDLVAFVEDSFEDDSFEEETMDEVHGRSRAKTTDSDEGYEDDDFDDDFESLEDDVEEVRMEEVEAVVRSANQSVRMLDRRMDSTEDASASGSSFGRGFVGDSASDDLYDFH
jgi:hypothetical protein